MTAAATGGQPDEDLTKALHSGEFLRKELQAACFHGSAVESLLILPMIEQATKLHQGIAALLSARNAHD